MNYQITVPQIHCHGCVNLIKLTMDEGFDDVHVSLEQKTVNFKTDQNPVQVKQSLESTFDSLSEAGYSYEQLKVVN